MLRAVHRQSAALRAGIFSTALFAACLLTGCTFQTNSAGRLIEVWGRRGLSDGRLQKPRAFAIDPQDRLYIVDMTARIQVFDPRGHFQRGWQTPASVNGRPTGLSVGNDGNLLVADTHYYRVLVYSPEGKLLRTLGGTRGPGPGEFGLVTDVVQDRENNYYVSEYGEYDRIQKFSADGHFLLQWGGHGEEPGKFLRPQNMDIDEQDRIWVADACNHRIQVFDTSGKLLFYWGREGSQPGEMYYPYDVELDDEGHVYVCEYGNHRVQKFTRDGKSLGSWGHVGNQPGELFNPWAILHDSRGRLLVLDTNNHRVQVVKM
ncbi:MAG: NHL repeat-containing protein [Planctomycetota bacterium]